MLPLPDEKSGPGPPVLVTSWLTESSLVQVTVVPFLTLRALGLNWMFFSETDAAVPPLFSFLGLAVSLPPPPLEDELLLSLPQPVATSASARTEQSTAEIFVMERTLAVG